MRSIWCWTRNNIHKILRKSCWGLNQRFSKSKTPPQRHLSKHSPHLLSVIRIATEILKWNSLTSTIEKMGMKLADHICTFCMCFFFALAVGLPSISAHFIAPVSQMSAVWFLSQHVCYLRLGWEGNVNVLMLSLLKPRPRQTKWASPWSSGKGTHSEECMGCPLLQTGMPTSPYSSQLSALES